jgi:hypothetical protein
VSDIIINIYTMYGVFCILFIIYTKV